MIFSGHSRRETLASALSRNKGNAPGFHFVRHGLAFSILLFHCYIALIGTSTGGNSPQVVAAAESTASSSIELVRPLLFALVGGFFALSGFLVTSSALRTRNTRVFFSNRALRILPALSAEVLLSAFLLGPLVTTMPLGSYFSSSMFYNYFWNLIGHVQFRLPGVFETNPWGNTVNLSLWTLPSELWCYAIMLLILATGLIANHVRLTFLIVVAMVVATLLVIYDPVNFPVKHNTTHFSAWYIVFLFMVGSLAFLHSDKIPLNPWIFIASLVSYYIMVRWDILVVLSGAPLVYAVLYVGMMRFAWFDRLLKMDLSYGTYLYGFPITQALIWVLFPTIDGMTVWGKLAYIAPATFVLTIAFAIISWNVIEKPALLLRKYVVQRKTASVAGGDAAFSGGSR